MVAGGLPGALAVRARRASAWGASPRMPARPLSLACLPLVRSAHATGFSVHMAARPAPALACQASAICPACPPARGTVGILQAAAAAAA